MMHAGFPGQRGDTRTTVDCKYYLEGRCALGDNCPFRHRPDKFNTAARVGLQPHSLPQICHFYLTGQCNKGGKCAFQHPVLGEVPAVGRAPVQPQDEMNIDFDDDESPKQPQQLQSNRTATPHNAPMPAQQPQARQQLQQAPAQPSRVQPAGPLQNRLGAHAAAQKRPHGLSGPQQQHRQTSSAEQDDTDQGKSSVFERLGRASVKPASALNRLSAPAQAAINSRQASGAAAQAANSTINRLSGPAQATASSRQSSGAAATSSRPIDARDFLVASISNNARAGRKEAEGVTSGLAVRRSVLQGARQSSEDLEPVSVSNRRVTAASRGAKAAGTTGLHAPKFATEGTPVSRKSALDRIARPQQSGSPASSSINTPAMAAKPRRATIEPYSTARSRVSPAQPSSSAQPSAAAAAATEATAHSQPASSTAASPQFEQPAAAASDKRGRPRIQWQPPTQAQREEAVRESRLNVSKRKASESGVTAAESTAAPADDPSPPKRMKASTDVAAEQVTEQPDVLQTVQPPTSSAVRPSDEAQIDAANSELQPDESEIDFARGSMDQVDDQDATADDEFIDDFDDEAAMRELDALT